MRKIFLAFLTTSALTLPTISHGEDDTAYHYNKKKPHITVATPGKPVNVLDYATSLFDSSSPKTGSARNSPGLQGMFKPSDMSNLKPSAGDKPQPKYSMKPILQASPEMRKDEDPPEDFDGDDTAKAAAAKAAAKTATKPAAAKAKVTAVKTEEIKKKVAVAAPTPKQKPAKLIKAEAKPVAAAKAEAPKAAPAQIKPAVVKVETNVPEKVVKPATPAAVVAVTKEVPKVETKEVAKEPEKPVAKNVSKITPKAEFTTEGDIERIKFTFTTPVAAAVFERFGYYWLVFYTDDDISLPANIKTSKLFASAKKVSAAKSELVSTENVAKAVAAPLVFNLELSKNAFSMVEKDDNTWEVEFDPSIDYNQEETLKLEEKPDSWQITAKGLSARVTIKDSFTNDYVEVFPLLEPGFNPQKITNGKFIFEKTVQGLALKTIGQTDIKSPEKDKLAILKGSADKAITTTTINTPPLAVVSSGKPLYAFQKWPQLKADDYRKAESKLRDGNRLDFGKFLFSQSLYSEAAVNLQGERGMDASFLTGASFYMLGRDEDAVKIFDSLVLPEGVDANELTMWKAAANFDLSQANPGAAKPVDLANFMVPKNLDNYPDEMRNRLILTIAERETSDGKYDDALKLLDTLPKTAVETPSQSYMKYLQGKIYDGQGKHARAREVWAEVAKSATDRESQAKATYEIIMQDYNGGKIQLEEAISKLNDIRILWRGDVFEYTLLSQLADMYYKNGQTYESLTTSKEILSSFPNFPHNLAIANQMRDVYQKEVASNFSDKEKTFRAVTIYYEFEELKPPGDKGDQITLQLADALARYDLLADSIKVLKKYSANLTDASQKAEISTRIAILDYLDNKPKDSLQELKDSQSPGLPVYLAQERRILEVRCLIETGELEKATSLLSSLPDEQANRFKADIYWKQKEWDKMLDTYDLMTQKNDEDIMRMGIAYVMVDDKKALQGLGKKYGDQMEKSQYAQMFAYITDVDTVDYRNLDTSLKLDQTEQLLQKYRDRIKTSGLQSVTGGNQKK